MKALLAIALLTVGIAQAKSIPTIADCKVTDRAEIWTGTKNVENTRTTGKTAAKIANALMSKGASVEATNDVLGVKRYETVELRTVLETNGTDEDPCQGIYYAVKSETCTLDATKQACETFCKVEWRGLDCR